MQQVKKVASVAGYAIILILAAAANIWEAHGTYLCEKGLATNRAWVGAPILGYGLIVLTLLVSVPALFLSRRKKNVVILMVLFLGIGISPTLVHWLFVPTWKLLNLY
jgi:hypothetical protein